MGSLEAINDLATFNAPDGIRVHEILLNKRIGRVEGLLSRCLLTHSLKYLKQAFIPTDSRKKTKKIRLEQPVFDLDQNILVVLEHGSMEEGCSIGALGGKHR